MEEQEFIEKVKKLIRAKVNLELAKIEVETDKLTLEVEYGSEKTLECVNKYLDEIAKEAQPKLDELKTRLKDLLMTQMLSNLKVKASS